jgi:sRNA-binding regulator protein Hfq
MANTSGLPGRDMHEFRAEISKAPQAGSSRTVAPDREGNYSGPRKLVRPTLSGRALKDSNHGSRGESPLLAHQAANSTALMDEASHAEAFYFQKQMQMQTLMAFVLEDGEVIEGYIEWYDRYAIKVRNGSRTLIYKSGIKYLYKVGEGSGQ